MIKRVQTKRLQELLERFPVVAVIGPRQVGKSTLVQGMPVGPGRSYFTLDDFDVLGLAEKDPKALLAAGERITIDEAQRCPNLLRHIKTEVDKHRTPGRFLLTGSADLSFSADLSRELVGRVGVLPLLPLSWRELNNNTDSPTWLQWINADDIAVIESSCKSDTPKFSDSEAMFSGGYPLSVTACSNAARNDWFAAYRFTYLERDVRQLSNIGSLADFARLFQTVAGRTAQILNIAALSRDVGLNGATTGRHLSLLEASFQIMRLAPWFSNMGKRLVKSPKLYWLDTGVLAHLLGLESWADAIKQGMSGAILETFIMMEIRKQIGMFDPSMQLHFIRTHGGLEVDGLIIRGLRQFPFEIKASSTVRGEDATGLESYMDLSASASVGVVFYRGSECRRLSRRVLAVPLSSLLT